VGADGTGNFGFDNLLVGFVTMIVRMSGDGALDPIPMALTDAGAQSSTFAWAFSALATVVLEFVSLNLFLALCCSALEDAAGNIEARERTNNALDNFRKRHNAAKHNSLLAMGDALQEGLKDFNGERNKMSDALAKMEYSGWSKGFRTSAQGVVTSAWFRSSTVILVLLYTLALMPGSVVVPGDHGISIQEVAVYLESVLVFVFFIEFILKLAAMGPGLFFSSQENILDVLLLICTLCGFCAKFGTAVGIFEGSAATYFPEYALRKLRMLRVAQLLRMMYKSPDVYRIMCTIFKSWQALLGVMFLCIFSVIMTSIVAMHLVGGALPIDENDPLGAYPRNNFETVSNGMSTTMQFIIAENWMQVMGWYMEYSDIGFTAAAFFCLLYLWSNGILFNLFVAVLLLNFGVSEEDKMPQQKLNYWKVKRETIKKDAAMELSLALSEQNRGVSDTASSALGGRNKIVEELQADLDTSHKSFFIFAPRNSIRVLCARVLTSRPYDLCFVTFITVACLSVSTRSEEVTALMENPDFYYINYIYLSIEGIVIFIFSLEMVLKSISSGFFLHSGPGTPYLRDINNIADFVYLMAYAITRGASAVRVQNISIFDLQIMQQCVLV
jgi:hypothetical protein